MTWSYVNAGTFTSDDDARTISGGLTLALPSGTLTGKLLIAAFTNVIGNGFTWSQDSGGYTQLATISGFEIWGKIAGASESAPRFDCSSAGATGGGIACFTGAPSSITGIIDTGPTYSHEYDPVTSHDTPALTQPSVDGCLILYGLGGGYSGFSAASVTTPNGATEIYTDYFTGAVNRISLGLAYSIQTTKASVGASSWSYTGDTMRSKMAVLALLPTADATILVPNPAGMRV